MLKNFSCFTSLIKQTRVPLLSVPAFSFANDIEAASKLKQAVEEEIKYEEAETTDLSEYKNFFANQGWKINFSDIQVELAKTSGPYNLRVLFNAKTPMGSNENQEEGQEEGQEGEYEDMTELVAYINKNGTDKWLCCEIVIAQEAQITMVAFVKDYELDRNERQKGRIPISGYTGPEISSLDENFRESLEGFIENVGINGEVLQRAAEFSVAYEHQFYIDWLKDFRSIA